MNSDTKRKAPAFQMYADDFLAGTSDMSSEEVGGYIRLLCHQWTKGGIPNDEERAARMAGLMGSPSIRYVLAKFSPCDDGMLRNARLEAVRAESEAYRSSQSEAGRKGAMTRWKTKRNDGDANGEPIATPIANTWPNDSSPSPSPNKEEEVASAPRSRSRFVPPIRDEVALEAAKIGLPDSEVDKFLNYYESNGWKVGKNPMKSWNAGLRNWASRWRETSGNKIAPPRPPGEEWRNDPTDWRHSL
jgi:uncharacterized protein YdaU (DUF1376 family)